MAFPWTDAQIAQCKQLYIIEGRSSAEVASILGGDCTRNSVIGKAQRMGWMKDHRQAPSSTGKPRPPSAPVVKRAPNTGAGHSFSRGKTLKARIADKANGRPGAVVGPVSITTPEAAEQRRLARLAEGLAAVQEVEIANDTAIPLIERGRFQCSWPVGEPARPADQMCCGRPVLEDANRAVPTYCLGHSMKALTKAAITAPRDAKTYERSLRRWAA